GSIGPRTVWILPKSSWRVVVIRATISFAKGEKRSDCTADGLCRPCLGPRRREDFLQGLERRAGPIPRHAGAHRARRPQPRRAASGMAVGGGTARVGTGKKLRSRAWYRVWASADPVTGMLRVGQQPLKRAFEIDDEGEASATGQSLVLDVPQPVLIGAEAAA